MKTIAYSYEQGDQRYAGVWEGDVLAAAYVAAQALGATVVPQSLGGGYLMPDLELTSLWADTWSMASLGAGLLCGHTLESIYPLWRVDVLALQAKVGSHGDGRT